VLLSRRRLPHLYVIGEPLFVTFRLHNSLPLKREYRGVLQLYDLHQHLEYKVFLDQYVLANAPLAMTLGEELDRSASVTMIWSNKLEDSEWCKAELEIFRHGKRTSPVSGT